MPSYARLRASAAVEGTFEGPQVNVGESLPAIAREIQPAWARLRSAPRSSRLSDTVVTR